MTIGESCFERKHGCGTVVSRNYHDESIYIFWLVPHTNCMRNRHHLEQTEWQVLRKTCRGSNAEPHELEDKQCFR